VSLKYAPWVKREAQFTPSEIDRMSASDARWVLAELPRLVRWVALIEIEGGDGWEPGCDVSAEICKVRRRLMEVTA
jgi:hypothetical protein